MLENSYVDPISRLPEYSVKTVLPGDPSVYLANDGKFKMPSASRGVRFLTPQELLQLAVDTAAAKGSASPSVLPIEGVLEHLFHEIEVLPQVLALEMQGHLSETKQLLKM